MTSVIEINLDDITLHAGSHTDYSDTPPTCGKDTEACFVEWCNLLLGRAKTDSCPPGWSKLLHRFVIRLNDALPDTKRQALKAFLPTPGEPSPLDGTADDGLDERRRWMAVDWAVRVGAPMWLEAAGKTDYAAELRALAPIVDRDGYEVIRERLWRIREDCWAARREALKRVREGSAAAAAVAAAVAAAAAAAVAVAAAAADAAADAVAVAVAVAVAAAAAVAVAVAAAAAAAVAVAAADAAAVAGKTWGETYDRVYVEVKARIEATYKPVAEQVQDSAIDLFGRMVRPV